jgi:NAD(P)H-flavin reductase
MKLKDFKGVFKKTQLTFIKAEKVGKDYYIIRFEKPKKMVWRAGEHGIFSLKHARYQGRKWHVFSVASSFKEDEILLGTRTGEHISNYKKALISLKKGDVVKLRGPFGWFTEQDAVSPMVLIGLGVGITPIRALLKDNEISDKTINVIYSSKETYLFKAELDLLKENKNLTIKYTKNTVDTNQEIIKAVNLYKNNAYYYIGGSPKAVKSVKKLLKSKGIKGKQIINDPFYGY